MAASENEQNDTISISDKVEILSTEDGKIKAIGEILSSDSSRQILKLLFNDSLTANQIAQKTGISLPLVIYHLKKMQDANVVKITNIGKNTKSHDMKYYTIDKLAIVILPEQLSTPARKSKSLFNSFSRIHRIATLGGASIAAWFSSQLIQKGQTPVTQDETAMQMMAPEAAQKSIESPEMATFSDIQEGGGGSIESFSAPTSEPSFDIVWSVVTVLSVIVAWLVIGLAIKHKQTKSH